MPKYLLKEGRHAIRTDGVLTIYEAGKAGKNVIETDFDLVKQFGRDKFELITAETHIPSSTESNFTEDDPLEDMTKEQLIQYAEENGFDLDGATRKADIIAAIRLAAEG